MWGHGRSYSTPQGPAPRSETVAHAPIGVVLRVHAGGADHVIANGFPTTRLSVLNNTIDTDCLKRDLEAVSDVDVDAFSRRHGLTPGKTALFLGGVDSAKGIDYLLKSAQFAAQMLPGFILMVGGAGAQLGDVQAAERSGAPVRALGRLDGLDKALALRAAEVLALPSSIGLVAVDSLLSGVPIVTRDNSTHGPEIEYIEDGVTSIWIRSNADASEYALALVNLLEAPARLATMRQECLMEAPKYSLDLMVDAFVEGVLAWQDVVHAGL